MLNITSSITINSASWGRASDISSRGSHESIDDTQEVYYDKFRLPYFKASLFATALEDCITQIRILDQCNTEIRLTKTMVEMQKLLADKYGVEKKEICSELECIDTEKLDCLDYKLDKLDNDRKLLVHVLSETYLDLSKHRRFYALSDYVTTVTRKRQHSEVLIEEEAKNKLLRRETQRQLRQQRNHIKSVTYDCNMTVENLKNRVQDAALNVEIRFRYIGNWQNARCEQNSQRITHIESPRVETIDFYKQRIEQEHRVHSEVELLINILINEILENVEHWMVKYEKDMEKMDLKIQRTKNKHETTEERRCALEEKLKLREVELNNWISFKDKREADRLYREKMTIAALAIQAWWRGLLVRLELGPYKPTKRPIRGDKKKK
ncbi:dynein regulatory complex protein 9-like isoform X1 [Pieris brassicae]|uniref:dynein regulatory complex protein 9-like isoform X1 n=1 Tax=Pieris brassicae TaxID=7116 RepID=UPI001E65FE0E|nr:dynein regulatory complex protein 9-like isoform X1 [Pieris brassicae]